MTVVSQVLVGRPPLPAIKVKWVRGRGRLDFDSPKTFLIVGQKGSGKSTLLESCALRYVKVIDLFGSRDNEGLAWLRYVPKDQVLFVVGDSVEIRGRWNQIKVKNLTLKEISKYALVLSVSAFYSDINEEFHGLNEIIYKCLYRRAHWREPWFLMVREASNFIYARIKISMNQSVAKWDFIYLLRESRHMGYAVGVDTIRWTSIDKEIRDVCDYIFVKRVGIQGLPYDLRFVYAYIDPPSLMNPPPHAFVLVSGRGPIGVGRFDFVEWHKKERDDLLSEFRIKPKYGDVPDYGSPTRNWLNDFDHGDLITRRKSGLSYHKIARETQRSAKTVHEHIKKHNAEVFARGYCVRCRRIKHALASEAV